MNFTLKVWRQKDKETPGSFEKFDVVDISPDQSFLEMLDTVNEELAARKEAPIAFDHDCREGICGMCSLTINGIPHGKQNRSTTCQTFMRNFEDGEEITIEPWRAKAFPVLRDLVVDRSAFDRVIQAGGYISVRTGAAPDANAVPIPLDDAEVAFDAAACIGCAACVAACPNASASLFVSAKIQQFRRLPQGQPERDKRAARMIEAMDREGFGNCSNHYACEAVCPKGIPVRYIADMNRDYLSAALSGVEFDPLPPIEKDPLE
ncbi:MAG: succinate dehydrogenase/fumarate reductase iron-sulfur subunit [Myxococcota bacterium]